MKILLVGALSWNPERMLSLCEQGHQLFGLWGRSMGWDQGPYPVLDQLIPTVQPEQAVHTINEQGIDCVYGLYQSYPKEIWGLPLPAVNHDQDVWELLRTLLLARAQGQIDLPIVQHFGFDVHELDLGVVRALDGHLICNKQKFSFWTEAVDKGGLNIDAFGDPSLISYLDGDLPKAEFMNDCFSERLSGFDHQIHTVCIGRPVNIHFIAAAGQGIHVHLYGNQFDNVAESLADTLSPRTIRKHRALLQRYLHLHPSLQTLGAGKSEVWKVKSGWVKEFSRYDAGWSYIGTPFPWAFLDEQSAVPNRIGTYLLAGLPVISEPKPGHYRYDVLEKNGIDIALGLQGYEGLRAQLETEIQHRTKSRRTREVRKQYSFDAGIPILIDTLENACQRYFARPRNQRIKFEGAEGRITVGYRKMGAIRATSELAPQETFGYPERVRLKLKDFWHRQHNRHRLRNARHLTNLLRASLTVVPTSAPTTSLARPQKRIAALERFTDESPRCGFLAQIDRMEIVPFELHRDNGHFGLGPLDTLWAIVRSLFALFSLNRPFRIFRFGFLVQEGRRGPLHIVPEVMTEIQKGEIDGLACFSTKGFGIVPMLAEDLNVPFTEALETGTQYFGEFAFELLAVVPYAYWLHQQGRLERTVACEDTRCLYYFSENHQERPEKRRYVPITEYPIGEVGERQFDKLAFPSHLNTSRWSPPPYGERFWDERFLWSRPTCVVCNKTSAENYLGKPLVNSIETDLLLELVGKLQTHYQVVYNRPRSMDIVNDHQRVGETGDIEALKKRYPDILTIQELHTAYPELSFNELQLRVFAGCRRFVSVVGGSSYLASWFGGTNVVYARSGWEVDCGAFQNWFNLFSQAKVISVSSPKALLATIDREFLKDLPTQPSPPSL